MRGILPSRFASVAGLVAVASGVALVTVVLGRSRPVEGETSAPSAVATRPLQAIAGLSKREIFFGDDLEARLDVVVDGRRADVHRVDVQATFRPFRITARSLSRESLGDGYERLVYRYRLACLHAGCTPPAQSLRRLRLPDAEVRAGEETVRAPWPALVVVSRRVSGDGVRTERLRTPSAVAGSARTTSVQLIGLTGLLALAAAGLLLWQRTSLRRAPLADTGPPAADPVESASARVRERLARAGWSKQRGALEHLAQALDEAGRFSLAREVRTIAWREQPPADEEVLALLERVGRDDVEDETV